jgi:hypothetical protein
VGPWLDEDEVEDAENTEENENHMGDEEEEAEEEGPRILHPSGIVRLTPDQFVALMATGGDLSVLSSSRSPAPLTRQMSDMSLESREDSCVESEGGEDSVVLQYMAHFVQRRIQVVTTLLTRLEIVVTSLYAEQCRQQSLGQETPLTLTRETIRPLPGSTLSSRDISKVNDCVAILEDLTGVLSHLDTEIRYIRSINPDAPHLGSQLLPDPSHSGVHMDRDGNRFDTYGRRISSSLSLLPTSEEEAHQCSSIIFDLATQLRSCVDRVDIMRLALSAIFAM